MNDTNRPEPVKRLRAPSRAVGAGAAMRHPADILTAGRIAGALALLLTRPLSAWFCGLFLFCGVTDLADGFVARRTGTAHEAGAILDSIADAVFVAVCLYKLLPVIGLPLWIGVWIGVIAALKLLNLLWGYAYRRRFIMLHTTANKVAGALLFALPLTLKFLDVRYSAVCVCLAATFAAVQEGHFIRTQKD